MKKSVLLRNILAGLLISCFVTVSFVSCGSLLGDSDEDGDSIYNFQATQATGNYLYYSSTETFKYNSEAKEESYTNCIYQISFNSTNSAKTKGTWAVYSRPKDSASTIEVVSQGKFEGSPYTAGEVELTYENGSSAGSIKISGEYTDKDHFDLKFSMNVSSLHKVIGAVDEK